MDNSSTGILSEPEDQSAPTFNQIAIGALSSRERRRRPLRNIGGALVLSFTVISSPIAFADPRRELRQSGSASTHVLGTQKQLRRVTLTEAWQKATDVYALAQKRRLQQREREARDFLWSFMDGVE